eukprot:1194176-Prorocentrum_minimum.AAC.1
MNAVVRSMGCRHAAEVVIAGYGGLRVEVDPPAVPPLQTDEGVRHGDCGARLPRRFRAHLDHVVPNPLRQQRECKLIHHTLIIIRRRYAPGSKLCWKPSFAPAKARSTSAGPVQSTLT